jgi:hypothetical protein
MIPPDTASLSHLVGGNHPEAPGSSTAAWSDVARAGGSCSVCDDPMAP